MDEVENINSWDKWSHFVKAHIDSTSHEIKEIHKLLNQYHIEAIRLSGELMAEIKSLKTQVVALENEFKSELNGIKREMVFRGGVWGLIAGAIPSSIALIYVIFKAAL